MSEENLGLALSKSISSENLKELGVDIADLAVDSLIGSNIMSNIPAIGLFYKAGQALLNIRDRIFLKKVLSFLQAHQDIPLESRVKFLSRFETREEKRDFGESVLILLDSVNHIRKAEILGRISRARILGLITEADFFILSECTDRVFVQDLRYLQQSENNDAITKDLLVEGRLANAGLMSYIDTGARLDYTGTAGASINEVGLKFVRFAINV